MARVLETVLTGRNLLSPILATAGRDVERFDRQVSDAHNRAGNSSTDSARRQREAGNTIIDSNGRIITSSERVTQSGNRTGEEIVRSGQRQTRTHREIAEQATLSGRTQEAANRSLMSSNSLLGSSLTPLTAGLGLVAAGIGYAAYRGAEFDAAMSQVQAASQASASDMNKLRDAAIEQGAKTKYSGEEAAQGITEMAKAGVSTTDILNGGLVGALNLAAAGQIDVAEAAETGATALSVFKLKGDQMSHVADLMAAGAGKAQGSVGDLSAALNQSALLAAQTGLSIEDTTGALAMFASNGLLGSDAGTSFKTMLQALTPNSNAAAKAMDAIGFSAYDAQGQFVGMESVAQQLKTGLSGLTEEQRNSTLETIFGSDAVRAASVLYSEGAAGVTEWTGKVNDAGYAQKQAAQLSDNLKGDLERLGGAFDAAATSAGSNLQGPLREVAQLLTGLVDMGGGVIDFWSSLPGPVQAAAVGVGAFALLRGPLDSMFTRLAAGLTSTVTGMGMAAAGAGGFSGAMAVARASVVGFITAAAPMAAVLAVAFAAKGIYDLAHAGDDAKVSVQDLNKAIEAADGNAARYDATTAGITDLTGKVEELKGKLADDGAWESSILGAMLTGASEDAAALKEYEAQLDELRAATERQGETVDVLSQKYKISKDEVVAFADAHGINLSGALDETQWSFIRLASATGEFTPQLAAVASTMDVGYTSMEAYAAGLGLSEDATKELNKKTEELGQSLGEFVTPLGAYTGLLEEKRAAEQKAAEDTAAATESTTDSWKDYAKDVGVTFDEYMKRLEEQVSAQDNWKLNMLRLAGEVSEGTLAELSRMGPEGAPLVADLVNRSDAELDRFDEITEKRSKEATDAWGEQLTLATPVLAAIGKSAGQGVVDELAAKLRDGTTTVADIAKQYGVNLAGGINPVLTALGKPKITYDGSAIRANGKQAGFADGGYTGDGDKHKPMGVVHGGEFVFTKEQTARAGVDNLYRAASKLNGYASGGYVTAADVPRPPSTAPFGAPVSTGADATMQKGFEELTAWLTANAETSFSGASGPLGAGAVSGQWMSLWNLVKRQIPEARINSTYRPGAKDAHGRNKAIDFGFGSGPGGAGSAGLASINRLLHDQVGANLYELIYDGIGDDRPDLKNGRPLNYSAGVRAQHHNHVHAAVYHEGTNYVPNTGWAYLQQGEAVIPAAINRAAMSAPLAPAAMPGYGSGGGHGGGSSRPAVTVLPPNVSVRFVMDGREFHGVIDTRVDQAISNQADAEHYATA